MSEVMKLSINGQSMVPPGFRFHPTEEELLHYYLRKKLASQKIDLDVIRDIDLNKLEPWDIQEQCKIGSTPQNDWYLFSHKDKKYPTGTRTNRATAVGFWKATGRDKVIYSNFKRIGMRKTLVFYTGRAPQGKKSHWIMHEYRLDEDESNSFASNNISGDTEAEDAGWVVCRVFKKKNYHKPLHTNSPQASSNHPQLQKDGFFNQILNQCMENYSFDQENINSNSCNTRNIHISDQIVTTKQGNEEANGSNVTQIPGLMVSPTIHSSSTLANDITENYMLQSPLPDWVALDRFVASQLNGESTINDEFYVSCNDAQLVKMQISEKPKFEVSQVISSSDTEFWSFALS